MNINADANVESTTSNNNVATSKFSLEEIVQFQTVIQPKSVTFATYNITAFQEDVMTLVAAELQKFANKDASRIRSDLFGQLTVDINSSDLPNLRRNYRRFEAEIKKLKKAEFNFYWKSDLSNLAFIRAMFPQDEVKEGDEIQVSGIVFNTYTHIKGHSNFSIKINPWAIPFLLYYGKGVGGTIYLKEIALTLNSKYSKRLYKILRDFDTGSGVAQMPLDLLRSRLMIPDSYDNCRLRKDILEVARREIYESGSPITFEYELVYKPVPGQKPKTKPAANTVKFMVHNSSANTAARTAEMQKAALEEAQKLLEGITDPRSDVAKAQAEACADFLSRNPEKLALVKARFERYRTKYQKKELDLKACVSSLQKIVRHECGFELRSPEHVLNMAKYNARKAKSGMEEKDAQADVDGSLFKQEQQAD